MKLNGKFKALWIPNFDMIANLNLNLGHYLK